jgi:hypothetical protein
MRPPMKRWATAALAALAVSTAGAVEIMKKDGYELNLGGRMQMFGQGQIVADPYRDHARLYLFQKNARLQVWGRTPEYKYEFQAAYGAEDVNGSNTGLNLLDLNFDIPLGGESTLLKIGQFRVPYSRERVADEATLVFPERSIQNLGFRQGHDIGLAVHHYRGNLVGGIATFAAGGRDVPERYLGERLGWPMTVVRLGYNDGVDKDLFHLQGIDLDLKRTTKAAFINAFYMHDTLIGHSTVLNLRTTEKNLLINGNWNPYINNNRDAINGNLSTGLRRGDYWSVGGDVVYRTPLSDRTSLQTEAEVNYAGYQNRYGSLHMAGGRAEVSVVRLPMVFGMRYAVLLPDRAMSANDNAAAAGLGRDAVTNQSAYTGPGAAPIHEIAPSVTWFMKGHDMKIVFDTPLYVNAPVATENLVGSYVLLDQPDQITAAKRNTGVMNRRLVFDARMTFQVRF